MIGVGSDIKTAVLLSKDYSETFPRVSQVWWEVQPGEVALVCTPTKDVAVMMMMMMVKPSSCNDHRNDHHLHPCQGLNISVNTTRL